MRIDFLSLTAAVLCTAGMADKLWQFSQNAHPVLLGVGIFYGLLALLFITRLPSQHAETRPQAWILALGGTYIPFLISCAQPTTLPYLSGLGVLLQCIGLIGMLLSLAQLGKGFGVLPAVRVIKTHGLYNWVRHPLYAAEVLFMTGLVLQVATPWNGLILALFTALQLYRAILEEQLLAAQTVTYQDYLNKVKYRFFPYVL